MKRAKKTIILVLLLAFAGNEVSGQVAEQNSGNNWVHPGAMKFIGMDFINTTTGTLTNNGTVWYSGNFTNNGTVDFTPTLGTTKALSQFAGDALQHISGNGTTRFYNLMFGSQVTPVAYSLEQNISVVQQVDFSKGVLTTRQNTPETMMNMLQFENGASTIHVSDNSYVDGFVTKTGNTSFTFPIGNGGFYRPVSIGVSGTATDCFAARYLYLNPDNAGYSRDKIDTTLVRISDKEYWVVNHTSGTSNGQVTLSWDVAKTSARVPSNLHSLAVARWNGTRWLNEGNTTTTGNNAAGTITANVTGYGVFTLANILTFPPVAVKDSVNTYEDTPVNGNVLANDSLFDGTTLTLTDFSLNGTTYKPGTTVSLAKTGTLTIAADGAFTFTPALNYYGILPAITYTIVDIDENTAAGNFILNVLPLPELIKTSGKPVMNNDGTFSWTYTLSIQNDTPGKLDDIQVEDNLDVVFKDKGCTYTVTHISATGGLTANGLYDGSNSIKTLVDGLSLAPNQTDSIRIEVKVDTHGQTDAVSVFNQATLKAAASFGIITMKSRADNTDLPADPTRTIIPVVSLVVIDGFSPNGDGINDKFVIAHLPTTRMELDVFNRSGNLVYKSSDYRNDWDGKGTGTFLGKELVDGTYYISYQETDIITGKVINKGVKFITIRR